MFKAITKNSNILDKKSFCNTSASFYLPGVAMQNNAFSIEESIRYYYNTSPLFTAIKLISDNLKSIPFVIKDNLKDEYIKWSNKLTKVLEGI